MCLDSHQEQYLVMKRELKDLQDSQAFNIKQIKEIIRKDSQKRHVDNLGFTEKLKQTEANMKNSVTKAFQETQDVLRLYCDDAVQEYQGHMIKWMHDIVAGNVQELETYFENQLDGMKKREMQNGNSRKNPPLAASRPPSPPPKKTMAERVKVYRGKQEAKCNARQKVKMILVPRACSGESLLVNASCPFASLGYQYIRQELMKHDERWVKRHPNGLQNAKVKFSGSSMQCDVNIIISV